MVSRLKKTTPDNERQQINKIVEQLESSISATEVTAGTGIAITGQEISLDVTESELNSILGVQVGYRNIPIRIANTDYTIQNSDKGKAVSKSGSSAVIYTIGDGVFAAGDVVTIANNNDTANITLLEGGTMDLVQGGTATHGNVDITPNGFARVFFVSAAKAIVSGSGVATGGSPSPPPPTPGDLEASASPSSVSGSEFRAEPAPFQLTVTSNSTTVTATGGSGSYTFDWQYVSGNTSISPTNDTSATTGFTATVQKNTSKQAVWKCEVDDGTDTVFTNTVSITLSYSTDL